MANRTNMYFFHLGNDHYRYITGTYLADAGGTPGLNKTYNNLFALNLGSNQAENQLEKLFRQIDILIVEDDKSDMLPIIDAALDVLKDKGAIGICPNTETLNTLIEVAPSAPRAMTLDLQLSQHLSTEESLKRTLETYRKISETVAWKDTVVVAISSLARKDVAEEMAKALHYRGDSLFKKDLHHLPKVLPDILFDAMTKHTHRSRMNATEEALDKISSLDSGTDQDKFDSNGFVGESLATQKMKRHLAKLAKTDHPVLLLGETGTGKEVATEFIHKNSPYEKGELVRVNVNALTPNLVESELFGWKEGGTSTATSDKMGLFELANNGTIFLDEIGSMSLENQAKVLRVLSSGDFYPIGSTKPTYFNGRVIAATCQDLYDLVENGIFREDLLYRLNTFTVEIPPLRKRRGDIAPLFYHFLNAELSKQKKTITLSKEAGLCLQQFDFPGNVRDLISISARLSSFCVDGETVTKEKLEENLPVRKKKRSTREENRPFEQEEKFANSSADPDVLRMLDIIEEGYRNNEKNYVIGKRLWPNKPKSSAGAEISQRLTTGKAKLALKSTPDKETRFRKILAWYELRGHKL